jgi:predicted type IV restriction endonuclease
LCCEPEESNPGGRADFFLKEKSSDFYNNTAKKNSQVMQTDFAN